MPKLIKEQPEGVLGRREWWQIGKRTALIAYGEGRCGLSISDSERHDITEQVAKFLQSSSGMPLVLIHTIDAFLIESKPDSVPELLMAIEAIPDFD